MHQQGTESHIRLINSWKKGVFILFILHLGGMYLRPDGSSLHSALRGWLQSETITIVQRGQGEDWPTVFWHRCHINTKGAPESFHPGMSFVKRAVSVLERRLLWTKGLQIFCVVTVSFNGFNCELKWTILGQIWSNSLQTEQTSPNQKPPVTEITDACQHTMDKKYTYVASQKKINRKCTDWCYSEDLEEKRRA